MECARCGYETDTPAFDDGEPGVLDSVTLPAEGDGNGRTSRFFFRLWRAREGNHEIARVHLCRECARRLTMIVWHYIDGRVGLAEPARHHTP